jgi:Ribonuclease G/E
LGFEGPHLATEVPSNCRGYVFMPRYPELVTIYRKILSNSDVEKFQIDLNRLEEWAFENEMIINPAQSKAVCFTKA